MYVVVPTVAQHTLQLVEEVSMAATCSAVSLDNTCPSQAVNADGKWITSCTAVENWHRTNHAAVCLDNVHLLARMGAGYAHTSHILCAC